MNKLIDLDNNYIKKLQHPIRSHILKILESSGSLSYNELKDKLDISSSTLYYHIKNLAELVTKNSDKTYSLTSYGYIALDYLQKIEINKSKNQIDDDKISENDNYDHLNILTNSIRRQILEMFHDRSTIRYSEFMRELKISSGNLFYHLKFLNPILNVTNEKLYSLNVKGKKLLNSYQKVSFEPNNHEIKFKDYNEIDELIINGLIDEAETILDQLLLNLDDEVNIILGLYFSSSCLILRGEFSKAQEYLNNAIILYNELKDKNDLNGKNIEYLFILRQIEINSNINKLEEGLKLVNELENNLEILKDSRIKGEIFLNLGELHFKKGNLQEALDNYNKSFNFFKELDNPEFLGRILILIGKTYYHLGNIDLGLKYPKEAIRVLKKSKNKLSLASALHSLGIIYRHKNQFEKGLQCFEEALEVYVNYGNPNQIVNTLIGIGSINQSLSDYPVANKVFLRALEHEEFIENKTTIGIIYKFLAYLKDEEYNHKDALDYYFKAEKIFHQTNRIMHQLDCLRLIGGLYYTLGELGKSKQIIEKMNELNKTVNSPRFYIPTLIYHGRFFLVQGYYKKSLEKFKRALNLAEEWKDQDSTKIIQMHLGECKLYLGRIDEGKEIFSDLLKESKLGKSDYQLSQSFINIAKINKMIYYIDWQELTNEFKKYEENIAKCHGFSEMYLGIMNTAQEQWSDALKYFKKSVEIENFDFTEKVYCYEQISEILFTKWKANSSEENLTKLTDFLEKWEEISLKNNLDGSLIKIQIIMAKIKINQLNFIEAKKILEELLKESNEKGLDIEYDKIVREKKKLNEKIIHIKL